MQYIPVIEQVFLSDKRIRLTSKILFSVWQKRRGKIPCRFCYNHIYLVKNKKAYVQIWYDAIDEANKNRDNFPEYGGYFRGGSCLGNTAVTAGLAVCALPDGFNKSHPMADAMSPTQGRDVNGTSAVQKSMSKLPSERFEMGTLLNQRLTPRMLATEDDVWRFVDYLRAFEALGNFHVQFNVIDCDTLHKAMEKPEEYKDLLVRVASYVSYFIELGEPDQLDIIHRTEQNVW